MNEIKIDGYVTNLKVYDTNNGKKMYRFGLKYYNGKDNEGKSKYAFINCKGFDLNVSDKQKVLVDGYLTGEEWTDKECVRRTPTCVFVKSAEDVGVLR